MTTRASKTTKKIVDETLLGRLTASSKEIKGRRATMIYQMVDESMRSSIISKTNELRRVQMEIETLRDLGPESEQSLRPTNPNFDSSKYASLLFSLSVSASLLKAEIEVMRDVYKVEIGKDFTY